MYDEWMERGLGRHRGPTCRRKRKRGIALTRSSELLEAFLSFNKAIIAFIQDRGEKGEMVISYYGQPVITFQWQQVKRAREGQGKNSPLQNSHEKKTFSESNIY